jgi:hypothetical protein
MKTPREVLLDQHRVAQPHLDSMRGKVVASLAQKPEGDVTPSNLLEGCREFFRMPRLVWVALAAAWMVIIALNLASFERAPAPMQTANAAPSRSPEILQALREQRRLFAELVGLGAAPEAEAPNFVPRPRSECLSATAVG